MKNFFILLIVLLTSITINSQSEDQKDFYTSSKETKILVVGEDLTYVVKYAFFNLGEVRFNVVEKTHIGNTPVYKTIAYIDSYPDLPFVSLHQVYESYIDSSLFPLKFFAMIFNDDSVFVEYNFIGKSKIEMQKGKIDKSRLWLDSTANVDTRMQDGLSILYFARMNFGQDQELSVPCFVNEKQESALLNFHNQSEPINIDAVEYQIDCLYLDGYTDFVSVYGLTGNFEGWFSNDEFSVPIKAKMNVIIGSINLELIKWNDKIWNPPLYKN